MAISPILLNGSIQQTDNVLHNQVKQVEKGMVDQGNIQVQRRKRSSKEQDRWCILMKHCLRRSALMPRKKGIMDIPVTEESTKEEIKG